MRDRRRKEHTHQTQEARSTQVAALERRIAALEKLLDQVRDIEETFSTDTGVHSFKKWLGGHRYHAERPGCKNILDKAHGFPPGGSRGTYRDAMRRAGFSRDEQDDVWTAWRDMLKDELLKKYYANRNQ